MYKIIVLLVLSAVHGQTNAQLFGCPIDPILVTDNPAEIGIYNIENATFNSSTVNPQIQINGIGHNALDDYVYGFVGDNSAAPAFQLSDIVRVDVDGNLVNLGAPIPANGVSAWTPQFASGTMDVAGNFYSFNSTTLFITNIGTISSPGTMEFTTIALSGAPVGDVYDITFNPLNNKLYGVNNLSQLIEITLPSGVATAYNDAALNNVSGNLPGSPGGAWSDVDGRLYFYLNGGVTPHLTMVDTSNVPYSVHDLGGVNGAINFDATRCLTAYLSKAVSTNIAAPGDTITYTFEIINPFPDAISIDFNDILPANLSYVSNSLSPVSPGSGTVNTFSGTTLNISNITVPGTLAPNNRISFTVDVLISAAAPNGIIDNQATMTLGDITRLSDDPNDPDPVDPTPVQIIVTGPRIATVKALTGNTDGDASLSVTEGDVLEYTITVTNTGNVALTNVTVTDPMITPTGGSTPCANVPVNGACTLVGTYTVLAGDVTTGSITNTGTGDSEETLPMEDVLVTPVDGTPALTTAKALTGNADGDASGTVTEGDVLEYTITVTNSGNVPLTNVTVSDPMITPTGGSTPCANVPVNGTCTLVGTYTVLAGDVTTGSITNTGTGDSEETLPMEDVLVTPVDGTPALTTAKALTGNADGDASGTVTEGDELEYTITVTNSGNVPLTNVTVSDPMITPTGGSTPCANVPVNGTCTLVGTYTVLAGDATTGSITNTGTGDSNETPPMDDVVITPVVGSPALTTAKALTGNADGDASGTVTEGDVLEYTITVTNSGNVPLTNVTVSDPMITPTGGSTPCANVPVNGTCTLVGTYTVLAGDATTGSITNTGTGDSNETPPMDDVVITPVVGSPALVVTKSAALTTDGGTPNSADENDVITFTVSVQNTGNVVLDNLVVLDPMAPGGVLVCNPTTLAPMAVAMCNTYTYVVTLIDVNNGGSIDNTAAATADDPNNVEVGDDDSTTTPITVAGPALDTVKELTSNADEDSSNTITLNDTLTYTVTVTNIGNVTLNNVVVTDPMITPTGGTTPCATVIPGASCTLIGTYVVQQSDVNTGSITNTGTGDSDETPPDPETIVTVVPQVASLAVAKTATLTTDNGTPNSADAGDVITFAVTVTNTGNVTLDNLVVMDPMAPGGVLVCNPTTLIPNQMATCNSYTYNVTQADADNETSIDNTATATADDPANNEVTDDDSTTTPITVAGPSLVVVKTMSSNADEDGSMSVTLDDTLTFTIAATNNGNVTLNNVVVSDPMITAVAGTTSPCATLAPGADCVLVGTYIVQQSDINNGDITNTGTGDSDETPPVTDVVVITLGSNPELSIVKTLTGNADEDGNGVVTLDDTVTFTIVATNVGDVDLTNVLVEDDMITPGSTTCASVPVNGTCTLVGTYVIQQSDVDNGQLTNVATAGSNETGIESDTTDLTITVGLPPEPAMVPSTTAWGQLLMLFMMMGIGLVVVRKRS